MSLANKAIGKKKYEEAQGYLDIAWQVAALTPGLEQAQAKNDQLNSGKKKPKAAKKGPSAAEIKKQKAAAAAAAAERKRLDNERKKKAQSDKKSKIAAEKKSLADKKAKQEAEKARRLAASKAQKDKAKAASDLLQKQKLNKQLADAQAEKARLEALANRPVAAPITAPKVAIATTAATSVAKEDSAPIASYPLSQDKITNRDRKISEDLVPMCKAIIDNDASIVLHTNTKADYRWLTVRLTLCTRRLDKSFRLRYSFQALSDEKPYMTLHPSRNSALTGS